jgi:ribonuclease III
MTLLSPEQHDIIARCEQAIGVEFVNKSLLLAALTHSSGAVTSMHSNERLEFLGDSILGFAVCRFLFNKYPDWNEGELTKVKSAVVSGQTCGSWARELELEKVIIVGKGVAQSGELPQSMLADAFEAIVAAIFLDRGLEPAVAFLNPLIDAQVDLVQQCSVAKNFKSALQHFSQREFALAPTYLILDQQGPDHDKSFFIAAKIGSREFEPAWGKSKKEAEQRAAGNALSALGQVSTDAAEELDAETEDDS